jgi:hypothetical protein
MEHGTLLLIQEYTNKLNAGEKITFPLDYDKRNTIFKLMGKGAKFFIQRFFDIGVGTSPQVNRLFFKNQDFKEFIKYDFLQKNEYFTTEEAYLRFIESDPKNTGNQQDKTSKFKAGDFVKVSLNSKSIVNATRKLLSNAKNTFNSEIKHKNVLGNLTTLEGRVIGEPLEKLKSGECYKTIKRYLRRSDCEKYYWIEYKIKNSDGSPQKRMASPPQFNKFRITPGYNIYQYPVPESHLSMVYSPSNFKLNDELNAPFENDYFFDFLHMFKYTMTKGYSKFRFSRVFRMVDILCDELYNTYYTNVDPSVLDGTNKEFVKGSIFDKTTKEEFIAYKYTYMYALRRTFTNDIIKFYGLLNEKGNDYLKKLQKINEEKIDPEKDEAIIQTMQSEAKKEEESKQKSNPNEDQHGGRSDIENLKKGMTARQLYLYTSRVYRILNMHIDTSNIWDEKDENVPRYLENEQRRFLLLAILFFTQEEPSIGEFMSYSYFQSQVKIKKLDSTYKSETNYELILILQKEMNSVLGIGDNFNKLNLLFESCANSMMKKYTQNLFLNPNLPSEYYRRRGITGYKEDTIAFINKFTFCLIMTPHFACSQMISVIAGIELSGPAQLTNLLTASIASSLSQLNPDGILFESLHKAATATLLGMDVATNTIISLINTPNCYMSLALMFFVLFLSIKPLQPHEGKDTMLGRKDYTFMKRSNRLNGKMYKITLRRNVTKTTKSSGGKRRKTIRRNKKNQKLARGLQPSSNIL